MTLQRWDDLVSEDRAQPRRRSNDLGARAVVAAGAILCAIGSFLPWAEGTNQGEPVSLNGMGTAGDGLILTVFAGVVAGLIWTGIAGRTGIRTLRWLSPAVVVLCVFLVLNGFRGAQQVVEGWDEGSSLAIGLWLAAAGVWLLIVGTTWYLLTHPFVPEGQSVAEAIDQRRLLREGIGAIVGMLIGAMGGLLLATTLLHEVAFFVIYNVAFIAGGFIGGWLGVRVGRRLAPKA